MDMKLRWICRMFLPALLHLMFCSAAGRAVEILAGPGSPEWVSGAAAVAADLLCIPVLIRLYQIYKKDSFVTPAEKGGAVFLLSGILCGFLCSLAGNYLMMVLRSTGHFAADAGQAGLQAMPLWLQLPGLCLITPAAEELVFRGLMYEEGKKAVPAAMAAVISAFLFAAGHGAGLQTIYAFLMALLFAAFYDRGGLPACIACHAGANLAVLTAGCFLR